MLLQARTIWRVASDYEAMWLKWLVVPWTSTTQFVLPMVVVVHIAALLLPEISELSVLFLPCRIVQIVWVAPKITVCLRKRDLEAAMLKCFQTLMLKPYQLEIRMWMILSMWKW